MIKKHLVKLSTELKGNTVHQMRKYLNAEESDKLDAEFKDAIVGEVRQVVERKIRKALDRGTGFALNDNVRDEIMEFVGLSSSWPSIIPAPVLRAMGHRNLLVYNTRVEKVREICSRHSERIAAGILDAVNKRLAHCGSCCESSPDDEKQVEIESHVLYFSPFEDVGEVVFLPEELIRPHW